VSDTSAVAIGQDANGVNFTPHPDGLGELREVVRELADLTRNISIRLSLIPALNQSHPDHIEITQRLTDLLSRFPAPPTRSPEP
jgi:LmbE family N-acetylglucosaminyl deacetylase